MVPTPARQWQKLTIGVLPCVCVCVRVACGAHTVLPVYSEFPCCTVRLTHNPSSMCSSPLCCVRVVQRPSRP
eukprot:scaffold50921_cov77-Phaeocystis_antarctica.AAC.6